MTATYDAIVIGLGGVGSAALWHLARRGLRILGLDRFPPGHDRGSSHGHTRIIRQAYFEHPDYVPLLKRAYTLWEELEAVSGRTLKQEVGLLQIGPAEGAVLAGVAAAAKQHDLPVEHLSPQQIEWDFPGYRAEPQWSGILERRGGILRVEACVLAHLEAAKRAGAELRTDIAASRWSVEGNSVRVDTDAGAFRAARLVVAAGAWSRKVLASLGLPLRVVRKPQYWFAAESGAYLADEGFPAFLFDTPQGIFYGAPQLDAWGVKFAEHTGGPSVADPLQLFRELDEVDCRRTTAVAQRLLPNLTGELVHHAACMYTLTPDENFIVDRHPESPAVVFAAGLSGHGFKFTPVLGEALAELASAGRTTLPMKFLSLNRPALTRAD